MRASKKRSELVKVLNTIADNRSVQEVFFSFVQLSACALLPKMREEEYLQEINRYEPKQRKLFTEAFTLLVDAMEVAPFEDLLGAIYMELGSTSSLQRGGEFYTPPSVSKLCANMALGNKLEIPEDRPILVAEPACGSGSMILACAECLVNAGYSPLNMQVVAVDINKIACDMALINTTLWGIPATVVHGNVLTLETWGGYRNVFWGLAQGSAKNAHRKAQESCLKLLEVGVSKEGVKELSKEEQLDTLKRISQAKQLSLFEEEVA